MKQLLAILILFAFNGVAAASPATQKVVRNDSYLLISTSPQQPPLEQLTTLFIPPGFHPTVGERRSTCCATAASLCVLPIHAGRSFMTSRYR